MAAATASETVTQAADLLKARMGDIKQERKALDAEERTIEKTLNFLGATAPKRGRPALPAGPTPAKATPKRVAKRNRKGGTRADQALDMIRAAGPDGIDANKIAKKMKIKPNYLYRVMGSLVDEKVVRKDGRTYFPLPHAA